LFIIFDFRRKRIEKAYNNRGSLPKMIITCGGEGVLLLAEGKSRFFKTDSIKKSEIEETTGAGDALTAGLTDSLVRGEDLVAAIKYGISAATATIKSRYTVNPNLFNEIEKQP
jgi:pseudouridine kinase